MNDGEIADPNAAKSFRSYPDGVMACIVLMDASLLQSYNQRRKESTIEDQPTPTAGAARGLLIPGWCIRLVIYATIVLP